MIFLSDSALKFAVNICEEKDNYKVLVATQHKEEAAEILNALLNNIENKKVIKIRFNNKSIIFNNGSSISIVPKSPHHGMRCNLLIVNGMIDCDYYESVLRPMETLK